MAVYKRGKTYWYKFKFNGQLIRESAKTNNKRIAQQIEYARKTQLAKAEVGIETRPPAPDFQTAVAEYLRSCSEEKALKESTVRRYETASKAPRRYFGSTDLTSIKSSDIENFKKWRLQNARKRPFKTNTGKRSVAESRVIKPATVNRELALMKATFNHFIKNEVIQSNPVKKVEFLRENNQGFVVIDSRQEREYLLAASQPLRDVAILMLQTGCRPGELYALKKSDVDLDNRTLLIEEGKTFAARRRIPLTDRAHRILESRLDHIQGEYVFPGGRDGADVHSHIVKLNSSHHRARKRAGLPHFRLYDLRHTFASNMVAAGVDMVTLMAILGHSRVQMVLRYAHPAESHKVEAIRKLEDLTVAAAAKHQKCKRGAQIWAQKLKRAN